MKKMDAHIRRNYCRRLERLATGRTAAYHVITRRRHLFWSQKYCKVMAGYYCYVLE